MHGNDILDQIVEEVFGNTKEVEIEKETGANLKKPPGFVGEVASWIDGQCRYPAENMAVMSAIVAVANASGLSYTLESNPSISSNLFAFCVAGSGTGKESVLQAAIDLHVAADISGGVHGRIKSEQELIRNIIRHQASYYVIDEIGIFLRQLALSHKSGGAAYLQGVIGSLMSIYSKSSGTLLVSGDIKSDLIKELLLEAKKLSKKLESSSDDFSEKRLKEIEKTILNIDKGIKNPFLSMIGFTTPPTFIENVTFDQVTNGFIGRAFIVVENDTNPKHKENFIKGAPDESIFDRLNGHYWNRTFDTSNYRIESKGERTLVKTDPDAIEYLNTAQDRYWKIAGEQSEHTGLEAVPRRGYEMVEKVSFILGVDTQKRTLEDVKWADAFVMRDMSVKLKLAYANLKEKSDPLKSMQVKILSCLEDGESITEGRFINRFRVKKSEFDKAVKGLVKQGKIEIREENHKFNKKLVKTLYLL